MSMGCFSISLLTSFQVQALKAGQNTQPWQSALRPIWNNKRSLIFRLTLLFMQTKAFIKWLL